MTEEEIKTALSWVKRLQDYVEEMESGGGRPSLCGVCLRPMAGSNIRLKFLREDIPFETEMHGECSELLVARETHIILGNLKRRAPFGARGWIEKEYKEAWDYFRRLRKEFPR